MDNSSKTFGKLTIPLLVLLTISFSALPAHAKYGGGTGEPNDPYLIFDANQMNAIGADSNDWDKHFKLMADVDLGGFTYTTAVIAPDTYEYGDFDGRAFTGLFDGNDHKIINLTIDDGGARNDYLGLFGYIGDGEVRNLGIEGGSVSGDRYVGGLVGGNRGSISNCYSTGYVSGYNRVGVLVGENSGSISNCYSSSSVSGSSNVGGLVGWNDHGSVSNCYSTGDVSGHWGVSGLVGFNSGSISNCYSTSDINGYKWVGGLVGDNRGSVSNCYSTGDVSAEGRVGGLVGVNGGSVSNCKSIGDVSAIQECVGGLVGINYGSFSNCYSTGSVGGDEDVGGLVGLNRGSVSNCYSAGDVSGEEDVGGLVGHNNYDGSVSNCYSIGSVLGDEYVGGLVGYKYRGNVIASFWDIDTSGQASSDGGTGLTTPEMQMSSTFLEWGTCGNEGIWTIDEGKDYPRLAWENLPGELIPAPYGGGSGELNDPYLIYTAEQLNTIGLISCHWDKHFLLCADIDLSYFNGTSFNIIGIDYYNPFSGVFDGNGHTISYFTYDSNDTDYVGLFGYVYGYNAEIRNLGLIDPNVDAGTGSYVGSLVGCLNKGTITNCYVQGGSVSGDIWVGGLVGFNFYSATINNCYSSGSVMGDENVGGLVGYNYNGKITNCYSTGSVSGYNNVGGLVGSNDGDVWDSFWDTETSGQSNSDGGTGKTTAEMQTMSTFISWVECDPVWTIDDGNDYPRLVWENKPGELITIPSGLYGGGSGEPNNPYLIYTAEQFNTIGLAVCDWDKHFKLMADIDLSGLDGKDGRPKFYMIGHGNYNTYDPQLFTGVFDGNDHTISSFTYDSNDKNCIGLFGYVGGEIKDLGLLDPNVDAGTGDFVGALVGILSGGTVTGCYAEGGSVSGGGSVGGLVGYNRGTISNCYSTGSVSGGSSVGGLVGDNWGRITNCYSTASTSGTTNVGGLVGSNIGTISDCYATGNVTGYENVGGLVGMGVNISNCYASGTVLGISNVGGLVGINGSPVAIGTITNCFSTGGVLGNEKVGGLVGCDWTGGRVFYCFWDIDTSGQTTSAGGTGKTTAEMQMQSTFTDAGWDFSTPVWTIDEGVDYPRLWWEMAPVLHAEPEITLGTSNTITWDPVPGANDYYAECAADANFTNIIYNTGWITETSCEFVGLELGQTYWYSVKARNSAGTETGWSNVESSLQVTLAEAVEAMLDPNSLKNEKMKNALLNKINAVQQMIDTGRYEEALNKLQNDILQKTDGCAETGQPDKNDWIITCEGQSVLYPLVIETIENVKGLMD